MKDAALWSAAANTTLPWPWSQGCTIPTSRVVLGSKATYASVTLGPPSPRMPAEQFIAGDTKERIPAQYL
jgi:hypothetical protein